MMEQRSMMGRKSRCRREVMKARPKKNKIIKNEERLKKKGLKRGSDR